MTKPFEGIRILDFTRYLAGPYGTYQHALLGADVIKIEPRDGDDMRRSQLSKEWAAKGLGPSFMAISSNKRSLTLDLTKPRAIEIVKRLAETADIVWENFRPGVMDKFGLGYEALSAINPKLIYCAVSGFGQNGPERRTAAFDGKIQAMSGIMSLTGYEEMGPTRAGFALCDTLGGMTAAFAVSSALFQRTRTGKGQFVDVSMLDASLSFISPQVVEYTTTGHQHRQPGNLSTTRKPTGDRFDAREGYLMLAVMTDPQFERLMRAIGRPEVLTDARFKDWTTRGENAKALRQIIEEALSTDDAKSWEKKLAADDVPCASVWSVGEVVEHPQLAHRDVLQKVDTPDGELTLVGSGFRLAHGSGSIEHGPPRLGQHSEQILAEAGYGKDEIAALREEAVI